jgi:5-carboxymethyl-2-hydroxymuconate isomerase
MEGMELPQITVEYTNNIKETVYAEMIFPKIHDITHQVTGAAVKNMKSRAVKRDCFYIASGEPDKAFVHLHLQLLEGRPLEMKQALGKLLLDFLESYFATSKQTLDLQITVKIDDIAKNTYMKYSPGSFSV